MDTLREWWEESKWENGQEVVAEGTNSMNGTEIVRKVGFPDSHCIASQRFLTISIPFLSPFTCGSNRQIGFQSFVSSSEGQKVFGRKRKMLFAHLEIRFIVDQSTPFLPSHTTNNTPTTSSDKNMSVCITNGRLALKRRIICFKIKKQLNMADTHPVQCATWEAAWVE